MNKSISEIFDYGDEIAAAEERYDLFDPARIKELTLQRIRAEGARGTRKRPAQRRTRSVWRTVLIAAAISALLIATALAVYRYSMRDRSIEIETENYPGGTYRQYSPVGYTTETTGPGDTTEIRTEETGHFIGSDMVTMVSPADSANRENRALKEWLEYLWNEAEEDMDVLLAKDDPYRLYIGYEGMARRLQSIADKYGLRLFQTVTYVSELDDVYIGLGIPSFMPLEHVYDYVDPDTGARLCCSGAFYDDGSFELEAVKTPVIHQGEETTVAVNIIRAVKGSLCNFSIYGDAPEDYTCETYETGGRQTVDLALGRRYSMVFAEREDCWVTIFVNGGTEGSEYLPVIDMDVLRQVADNVDFSLLDVK